ncbi:MAG: hypothetical protein ACRDD1_08365 [Planctomycetia bacterium]
MSVAIGERAAWEAYLKDKKPAGVQWYGGEAMEAAAVAFDPKGFVVAATGSMKEAVEELEWKLN